MLLSRDTLAAVWQGNVTDYEVFWADSCEERMGAEARPAAQNPKGGDQAISDMHVYTISQQNAEQFQEFFVEASLRWRTFLEPFGHMRLYMK